MENTTSAPWSENDPSKMENTTSTPWIQDDPTMEFIDVLLDYFLEVYLYKAFQGDSCELHTASANPALRKWCLNLDVNLTPLNLVGDPSWYSFDADLNVYVFNYHSVKDLYYEYITANDIMKYDNVRRICEEDETQLLQILKFMNTELLRNFLVNKLGDKLIDMSPPLFMKVYEDAHSQFEQNKEDALELRRVLLQRQDEWLLGYLSYSRNAVLYIDMHGAYYESLGTIKKKPQTDETPDGIPPLGRTFTHIHLTIPSQSSYCNSKSLIATEAVMNNWDWEKQWAEERDKVSALQKMSKTYTDVYVNLFQDAKRDQYRMGMVRWYNMLDGDNAVASRLLDKKFSAAFQLANASANGIFFVNEFTGERRRMFIETPIISESIANVKYFYLKDVLAYFYGLGFANVVLMDVTCNTMKSTDNELLKGRDARHFYFSFAKDNSVDRSSLKKEDMNNRFNLALTMLPEHHGETWFAFRSERQFASLIHVHSSHSTDFKMHEIPKSERTLYWNQVVHEMYKEPLNEAALYNLLYDEFHLNTLKRFRAANLDKLTPPILAVLDRAVEAKASVASTQRTKKRQRIGGRSRRRRAVML